MNKRLLLHTCCAPCLVAPYYKLNNDFDITVFWYNHNIHPTTEYNNRRDNVREFVRAENISYIEQDKYGLMDFFLQTIKDEANRCFNCYKFRLSNTVNVAIHEGYDAFSTTLLYSKYQKHEMIQQICSDLAKKYGVKFYYQDMRTYWQEGITLSKKKGMYRQKYCGCIFSEYERFEKSDKI